MKNKILFNASVSYTDENLKEGYKTAHGSTFIILLILSILTLFYSLFFIAGGSNLMFAGMLLMMSFILLGFALNTRFGPLRTTKLIQSEKYHDETMVMDYKFYDDRFFVQDKILGGECYLLYNQVTLAQEGKNIIVFFTKSGLILIDKNTIDDLDGFKKFLKTKIKNSRSIKIDTIKKKNEEKENTNKLSKVEATSNDNKESIIKRVLKCIYNIIFYLLALFGLICVLILIF